MCSGRISHGKYIVGVKPVFFSIGKNPFKYKISILDTAGILEIRCKAVSKIHYRKSPFRKTHTIILITFFIAVHPGTAVNTDNDRKFFTFFILSP